MMKQRGFHRKVNLLSLVVFATLICSCANMSTVQTARALPPGRYRLNLGGGLFSFPDLKTKTSSGTTTTTQASNLPYLEFGGRLGVSHGFDAGAKLTLPGTFGADGKYQFIDTKEFAAAIGLGLSYIAITGSPNSTSGIDARAIDATLPLYFSHDITPFFGVYTSPKFVFRQVSGTSSQSYQLAGGTLGLRIGNESGVFIEGTYMKYLNASTSHAYQVNAAFFFGDAPSVPNEKPIRRNHGKKTGVKKQKKDSNSVLE